LAEVREMRRAFAVIGDAPGGRGAAAEALVRRLGAARIDLEVLAVQLRPVLEELAAAHRHLVALDQRLAALVPLALATGRFDHAADPASAAMATLQADSGMDGLVEQLAAAGVEPR
jgi:hypothetical protein